MLHIPSLVNVMFCVNGDKRRSTKITSFHQRPLNHQAQAGHYFSSNFPPQILITFLGSPFFLDVFNLSHGHRIPSCGCAVCYPVADCGNFGSPKLQAISTIGRNYVVRKPPAELWRHQNRVRGEKFQSFGAASQFTAPYEAAKSGEGVSVSVKSALAG